MVSQLIYGLERKTSIFWAVLKRETQIRFGIRSIGWIEEVGAISVHVIAFAILRILLGAVNHDGMEILPFTAIGVMVFWCLRTGVTFVSNAPNSMIRYTEFPQVTLLDVALARGFVNLALCLGISFATFYTMQFIGYSRAIRDPLMVLSWLTVAGILGMVSGLALMWLFYVFPFSRTVLMTLLMRLIAVVSGTFFVYTDLPYTMRPIANWFPPLHINDKIREAYFYTFKASWASPNFVFLTIVIIFGFGLLSCEATRRQLKVR